jgi:hypothetical protein
VAEVDFGYAWDFIDDAGRIRQLVFGRNWAPPGDPRVFDGTGQLVAMVTEARAAPTVTAKLLSVEPMLLTPNSTLRLRVGKSGRPSGTKAAIEQSVWR